MPDLRFGVLITGMVVFPDHPKLEKPFSYFAEKFGYRDYHDFMYRNGFILGKRGYEIVGRNIRTIAEKHEITEKKDKLLREIIIPEAEELLRKLEK